MEDDLLAIDRAEFKKAFHVVRAANILNRAYFPEQVLTEIITKLKGRLKENGLLVVCRTADDGTNNATIFRLTAESKLQVMKRLGSGSEIEEIASGV
jgi:chemotaxis methyl-accepting protein methylase